MMLPLPRPSHMCIFRNPFRGNEYFAWGPVEEHHKIVRIEEATTCGKCGDPIYRMPAIAEEIFEINPDMWTYRWVCAKCISSDHIYSWYPSCDDRLQKMNTLSEDDLLDLYCELYHEYMFTGIPMDDAIMVLNRLNSIRKL